MPRRFVLVAALAVALVQIGVLSWMIAGRAAILRDGAEIVLAVEPVDPRSLLRGDYVRLAYNISRVPRTLFAHPPPEADRHLRREVRVRLKPGADGVWQPVLAGHGEVLEPPPGAGEVDIAGWSETRWTDTGPEVSVDYGIERFYVPEGEGRAIEENLDLRAFRMHVAVGEEGTAQIKALYDGDTLVYAEPLY